jgi:hypothetical protein
MNADLNWDDVRNQGPQLSNDRTARRTTEQDLNPRITRCARAKPDDHIPGMRQGDAGSRTFHFRDRGVDALHKQVGGVLDSFPHELNMRGVAGAGGGIKRYGQDWTSHGS